MSLDPTTAALVRQNEERDELRRRVAKLEAQLADCTCRKEEEPEPPPPNKEPWDPVHHALKSKP